MLGIKDTHKQHSPTHGYTSVSQAAKSLCEHWIPSRGLIEHCLKG